MHTASNSFRIFTTEPQLTRALAAEIRHSPDTVKSLLERKLGTRLGIFVGVECEKLARVDIMCRYILEGVPVNVAIEAKINHHLSEEQLIKESNESDYLVALVQEEDDASEYQTFLDATITWKEILEAIPGSRVLISDVNQLPAQKVWIERKLRSQAKKFNFGPGWEIEVARGGSAMPGITIQSPPTSKGDRIVGQIQVIGRSMPEKFEDIKLEFYAGTRVFENEDCYPDPSTEVIPRWVQNAKVLYDNVLEGDPSRFNLKTRKPGYSKRPLAPRRKLLTQKYLSNHQWLAQGYIEWALGVRAHPMQVSELAQLATSAEELFIAWYKALENQQSS